VTLNPVGKITHLFSPAKATKHLADQMHLVGVSFTKTQGIEKQEISGDFMASPTKEIKKAVPLPKPNPDFYQLVETLPPHEYFC
jgi:hypothetical protein